MEMFILSYVNELCIYLRLSFFKSVLPNTQNPQEFNRPVSFTNGNVLLSYVNETMYLFGNLPFFKIHVNHFVTRDNSPGATVISMYLVDEGPAAIPLSN